MPIEGIGLDDLDDLDDLDAMTVDWSTYDLANPSGLKPTVLRDHQVAAVEKVRAGFGEWDGAS